MNANQRGSISAWALALAMITCTFAVIGLRARTADLSFEGRAPDRVCARWAAESGIVRLQARLRRGVRSPVAGKVGDGAYAVTVRPDKGAFAVESVGTCGDRPTRWQIDAVVSSRGEIEGWTE